MFVPTSMIHASALASPMNDLDDNELAIEACIACIGIKLIGKVNTTAIKTILFYLEHLIGSAQNDINHGNFTRKLSDESINPVKPGFEYDLSDLCTSEREVLKEFDLPFVILSSKQILELNDTNSYDEIVENIDNIAIR
ncbi:15682_t:CDS:2 [Funneliformis geosporum]|uniref:17961_t:CDS:1 n=1 Tax=Funneliformis geosporum TaxID=1117311 RepID=A0A9W4SD08_9GLOM|nr:17961_t:CDS:2 [Funneliformis geosporum]CAI2163423.1 15682_t:CDS:2 [Funneliformis geosporum]